MKWSNSSTLIPPDCSSDCPHWCWLSLILTLPWVVKDRERGRLCCASRGGWCHSLFQLVFSTIPTTIFLRYIVTFPLGKVLCINQMNFLLKSANWYSLDEVKSSMRQHLLICYREEKLSLILVWVYLGRPMLLIKVTGSRSLTLHVMMSQWEDKSSSVVSWETKHPFF